MIQLIRRVGTAAAPPEARRGRSGQQDRRLRSAALVALDAAIYNHPISPYYRMLRQLL